MIPILIFPSFLVSVKPVLFKIPIRGHCQWPKRINPATISSDLQCFNTDVSLQPRPSFGHIAQKLPSPCEWWWSITFGVGDICNHPVAIAAKPFPYQHTFADLLNTLGMHCRCRAVKIHTISGNSHQWLWQINQSKSNWKEVKIDS